MPSKNDAKNENSPLPKGDILDTGEMTVDGDTVTVKLTNPADPVEQAVFVQRKKRAIAFVVNDVAARFTQATKGIRPFEE